MLNLLNLRDQNQTYFMSQIPKYNLPFIYFFFFLDLIGKHNLCSPHISWL